MPSSPASPRSSISPTPCSSCSIASAAPASASCSRAPKGGCSTSTTAPSPLSPPPTRWQPRPPPARVSGRARFLCARHRQGLHPGSAPAPSRPSRTMRSAMRSARAAMSSAPSPAASGAAAGSTPRWFARRSRLPASRGSPSPSSTCWTALARSGFPPATPSMASGSTASPPIPASRPGSSRSTSSSKAGRPRPPAPAPGRRCRRRPSNMCSLDRGDRVPGHAALYQPGARGHDLDARSFRRLTLEPSPAQRFAIRSGLAADLPRLVAIENGAFAGDRLSRRALARHLRSPAALLVATALPDRVVAYALLLFRANARRARLYSLAVDPQARGSASPEVSSRRPRPKR